MPIWLLATLEKPQPIRKCTKTAVVRWTVAAGTLLDILLEGWKRMPVILLKIRDQWGVCSQTCTNIDFLWNLFFKKNAQLAEFNGNPNPVETKHGAIMPELKKHTGYTKGYLCHWRAMESSWAGPSFIESWSAMNSVRILKANRRKSEHTLLRAENRFVVVAKIPGLDCSLSTTTLLVF